MTDNLSVKISADVTDLQTKFAVASAQARALTQDFNKLAREAASGGMTDELKAKLDAAGEAMLLAKAKAADLSVQLKALQPAASGVSGAFSALQSTLGMVGIGIGVAELIAGFKDLVTSSEEFGLETAKMAAQLGISENDAASLSLALKGVGSSTDEYTTLAMRLESRLRTQEQAWRAYGMATRDANGNLLSGKALMDSAISTFEQYKAGTDQNEFATEVFGRSAKNLYNVIRANSALQKEAADILREFGVVTDGAGSNAAQLEAAISREKMEWLALELAISGKLSPTITAFIDWAATSGQPVMIGLADALKGIATAGIIVGTVFDEDGRIISGVLVPSIELIEGAAKVSGDILRRDFDAAIKDSKQTIQAMGSTFHDIAGDMERDAKGAADAIAALFGAQQGKPGPNPFQQGSGDRNFVGYNPKAADEARKVNDEIAQSDEQLALKQISAAESANAFELQMGEESLDQWKANATKEADAKYAAELTYLEKKAAADKGKVVEEQKDLDQIKVLHQEHADQLAQIDQQYAEKKRAEQQQELAEFITAQQSELEAGMASYEEQYKAGAISANQKAALEIALTEKIHKEIDDRLEFEMEAYNADSKAYQALEAQKEKIDKDFQARHDAIVKTQVSEDTAQWNKMLTPFNNALQQMLQGTKSFASIAYDLLDKMIMNVITGIEKMVIAWVVGEKTKTTATNVGNTARTTSNIAASGASSSVEAAADSKSILSSAYTSAASAYKSVMQSVPPPANLVLAPVAAAGTFAAVAAFGDDLPSFEVGAWEINRQMVAHLHPGEMVVPQNFASGLRAHGSFAGGTGDVHMHYGPTINSREPASLKQMLVTESSEMLSWLNRQVRNGALKG